MHYFESIEKQKQLKKVLDSWLEPHTPFRHHCGVKGLGCDCIHFVARVCEELGLLVNVKIPDYPKDWHLHNTRELLAEGIERELKVERISLLNNCLNGDIACSHYGKAASHGGVYFDGYVYQALNDIGVCKINFNDRKLKKQMRFIYRILK